MIEIVRVSVRIFVLIAITYPLPVTGQNGCVRKNEFLVKLSNRIAAPSSAYLESLSEFRWTTEGWHLEQHTTHDYNAFGRTASWRHTWNGAEIAPERAFKTDFDENRQVELREEVYDHPSWIPARRSRIEHRRDNHVVTATLSAIHRQSWNGFAWMDDERTTYTHDDALVVSGGLTESWNGAAWEPIHRFSIAQIGADVEISDQVRRGEAWVNAVRSTFRSWIIRDLQVRLTQLQDDLNDFEELLYCGMIIPIIEYDEWSGTSWIPAWRQRRVVDGLTGAPVRIITESWTDGTWNPTTRLVASYNPDGTLASIADESYISDAWTTLQVETHVHDEHGRIQMATQQAHDEFGHLAIQRRFAFEWRHVTTASESEHVAARFALEPAYPNPFNPTTRLVYHLAAAGPVAILVYDTLGRRVATLADGIRPAGTHEVAFNAGPLRSGQYLVRLEAAGTSQSRVVTLIK